LQSAAYFILAAAVFDFLDGFAARLLRAFSAMGKDLDSLADVVSFGVAPACIMYVLLFSASVQNGWPQQTAIVAFIITVFAALRLAKFNTDSRQTDSFIGLPTPANALFICSLAFVATGNHSWTVLAGNIFFLLAVIVVLSFLMVAELPLFSLKFKSFDWKSNKIRYIFVIISALVFATLKWSGLAAVILIYIILSVIINLLCDRKSPAKHK
jgi:CDP-diacylglycerol--serine O-phosphatidyltransferase